MTTAADPQIVRRPQRQRCVSPPLTLLGVCREEIVGGEVDAVGVHGLVEFGAQHTGVSEKRGGRVLDEQVGVAGYLVDVVLVQGLTR